MPTKPERRFTLADAMVLVAATAAGLALSRAWSRILAQRTDVLGLDPGLLPGLAPLTRQVVLGWPVVAMWTLALVALRLRKPRPIGRRLFSPPGVATCVVASVMMGLEVAYEALLYVASMLIKNPAAFGSGDGWSWVAYWSLLKASSPTIGLAVAASWVAMALARRWRPERGWIDRAGLVVGALWIILVVLRFQLRTNSHLDV